MEDNSLTANMLTKFTVQTDVLGDVPLTKAWLADIPGTFDLIIDYDNDGLFTWKLDGLTGFRVVGKVAGVAWHDLNLNGIRDPLVPPDRSTGFPGSGDPVLAGVGVSLFRAATDDLVAQAVTGSDGRYQFDGLTDLAYYLTFDKPDPDPVTTRWRFTLQNAGPDDRDSDPARTTGRTDVFALDADPKNIARDAGLYLVGYVGDTVFADDDPGNGANDDPAPSFPYDYTSGLKVQLLDAAGMLLRETYTGAYGAYRFDRVEQRDAGWQPLQYRVQFYLPPNRYIDSDYAMAHFHFSPQYAAPPEWDSDPDDQTGLTPSFTINQSDRRGDIDCGVMVAIYIDPPSQGRAAGGPPPDGQGKKATLSAAGGSEPPASGSVVWGYPYHPNARNALYWLHGVEVTG